MERERYGEGKEELKIQSMVKVALWHGHVWLPVELGHWCLMIM